MSLLQEKKTDPGIVETIFYSTHTEESVKVLDHFLLRPLRQPCQEETAMSPTPKRVAQHVAAQKMCWFLGLTGYIPGDGWLASAHALPSPTPTLGQLPPLQRHPPPPHPVQPSPAQQPRNV